MKSTTAVRLLVFSILLSACSAPKTPDNSMPVLHIDAARVGVAGLSSGAYMATQAQLAYPEIFHKSALVAGGPFGCAQGKIETALSTCMKGVPAPDIAALVQRARERADKGEIGALKNLAGAKIYILHGKQDPVVAENVAQSAADFYNALKSVDPALATLDVVFDGAHDFSHTLPTETVGTDCGKVEKPFLGKCGFDAAGAIFAALYGPAPRAAGTPAGELRRFDQNAFKPGGADALLADNGYVYVPPACAQGKACGVLVALHGCQQNADNVGEAFVRDAGFNRWADAYDVAVLYPQTRVNYTPLNPKACWDWFGYSGANYDSRDSVQLRWLTNALAALGLPRR
jgi:poly(3-hydroxybutyrate) depolymerase